MLQRHRLKWNQVSSLCIYQNLNLSMYLDCISHKVCHLKNIRLLHTEHMMQRHRLKCCLECMLHSWQILHWNKYQHCNQYTQTHYQLRLQSSKCQVGMMYKLLYHC